MCTKIGYEDDGNYSYYHEIILDNPLSEVDSSYSDKKHPTYGYYDCKEVDDNYSCEDNVWYLKETIPFS